MPTSSKLVVVLLAVLLPLAAAAQRVDPKISPDFQARRALVKSAFRPTDSPEKPLPPVGLLGRDQFNMLGAAWTQFHRSVSTGDVEALRSVVRNARACKAGALAVKAELLMESRVRMAFSEGGEAERTMGEWIIAFGARILPEQIGETATPFIVSPEHARRVRFGNANFVEVEGGHWRVDLGC